MKKTYIIDLAVLAAVTTMLSVGCNPVYNFDNLSKEMTVGAEGMTAPLGQTGKITLDSLLKESGDVLALDADGNYSFSYSDSLGYTAEIGVIAPVSDIIPDIDSQNIGLFDALDPTMPNISDAQTITLPAPFDALTDGLEIDNNTLLLLPSTIALDPELTPIDETISFQVPDEIASLGTIKFGADGQGSTVSVRINIGKLAPITENRTIDFSLTLPAGVTITSSETGATVSQSTGSTTNNHLVLNGFAMTDPIFDFDFKIVSIDASDIEPVNGTLTIPFNITYDFGMNANVKAGIVTGSDPQISISTNFVFHSATLTTGTIEQAFDFSTPVSQTIGGIPEEVAAIESLVIEDATTGDVPQAVVAIAITGAPVETITIKDIAIDIPAFIDVDAPAGWTLSASNVLTKSSIDINTSNASTQLIALPIKGFKNLTLNAHSLTLDDAFAISGKATVATGSELNIASGASSAIAITPSITLGDIKITEVVGRIDLDLSEYIEPQEIDLSSVSEALGEDTEIRLNLVSPDICLTVTNPIGIPINGTMKLTPYDGATAKTPIVASGINIQPADNDGNAVVTKLLISGDPNASKEGFTLVHVNGLADIINEFPTKLVAEISLAADNTTNHTLVLKEGYTFNVKFDVAAALKFGTGEGAITYNTVIDKIDLGDIPDLGKIEKASIAVQSKSTLPMDVTLSLELQDADGNPVSGITSTSTGKIEGSNNSSEKTSASTVSLAFADGNISALSSVKQIKCVFSAATLSGGALNPDQYLDAKLLLVLDDGITVDLDKLFDKSEEK